MRALCILSLIDDTQTFSPTLLLDTTLGFTRGAEKIFTYPPFGSRIRLPIRSLLWAFRNI